MAVQSFPHAPIRVRDISGGSDATAVNLPLHAPVFFLQTEMGEPGIPFWGDMSAHSARFGSKSFDPKSKFYTHQSFFATTGMANGCFIVRMVDDTAQAASLVLLATLTQTQVPQYKRDVLGGIVLDSNGKPVVEYQADGTTPLTEPGLTISWSTRELAASEEFNDIAVQTIQGADGTSTVYPILAMAASNPGSGVNRYGFRLYSTADIDTSVESRVKSAMYRFAPVLMAADTSGTVSAVTDLYGQKYNDVSLKDSVTDPSTNQDVSLNEVLSENYTDQSSGESYFPFQIHTFSDNVELIGKAILAVSPELATVIDDPFEINLITAQDSNGNPYEHFLVDSGSAAVLNANVVQYLQGGTDGTVSLAQLESLFQAFCTGTDNVEFRDNLRYPISHVYDSGFTLPTKYAMLNLLSIRDDIAIDLTTLDATATKVNTPAQDQSIGAALLARARTYPESEIEGTEAIRVTLFMQSGLLSQSYTWKKQAPTTFQRLLQRLKFYGGDHVTGSPKERPNSEVTAFRSMSWTAALDAQRQLNWDTALNVVQYADRSVLFFADLRSVFSDETSILSDVEIVDLLVFLKHVVRNQWTYFSGGNKGTSEFSTIKKQVEKRCNYVFGSYLPVTITPEKTALDKARGWSTTIHAGVSASVADRVWDVIITTSRTADDTSTTTSGTSSVVA